MEILSEYVVGSLFVGLELDITWLIEVDCKFESMKGRDTDRNAMIRTD
jgi:hypothetical protein